MLPVAIIAGLIELGKIGLQAYFSAMRMAGKSEAEIDAMYQGEKKEFEANPPESLPDVPEDTDNNAEEVADAGPDTQ